MKNFRTILRRLRTLLWTALTLVTVLAAVLVGVGKLMMPYSVRFQPQLEEWLSQEFNQPVRLGSFSGEWKAFGPRISMQEMTFLDAQGLEAEVAIREASLEFKPLNWLVPGRPLYSFGIVGADLELVRHEDGTFALSGLGVSDRGNEINQTGLRKLATVGELRLRDSRLSFIDHGRDISLQFAGMQSRLQMDGKRLATELRAELVDGDGASVLGEVEATLLIELDDEQRMASADWHLISRELMVAALRERLPERPLIPTDGWLNAELWGNWSRDTDLQIDGIVDVRDAVMPSEPADILLPRVNSRMSLRYTGRSVWRVDLSDLLVEQSDETWRSSRVSLERNLDGNLGLWVSADEASIALPMSMAQQSVDFYQSRWPQQMPKRAEGRVESLELVLDARWRLSHARGSFNAANIFDWDRWPDVIGIDGKVELDNRQGTINIQGQDVSFDWPRNFPDTVFFDIPACRLDIRWGAGWNVDARECRLRNEDVDAHGRMRMASNTGKPAVDLNFVVDKAKIASLRHYWPESVMPPGTLNWLRRGLVRGQLGSGRYSMRGDMDDWPFRGHQGQLEVSAAVSGGEIDYVRAWPSARNIDAVVDFRGVSMDVRGSIGAIAGVAVQEASARIPDFTRPLLELDYESEAPLPELMAFIRATPLMENIELDPDRLLFSGDAITRGTLYAPLGRTAGELSLDGRLQFTGNGFESLDSGIRLEEILGEVAYDVDGFEGLGLEATFREAPATLELVADWDADVLFRADIDGYFPVRHVIPDMLLESEPIFDKLGGACSWHVRLQVETNPERGVRETWLELSSSLVGAELMLPAPFNKGPDEPWPMVTRYPIRSSAPVVTVSLPGRGMLQFDLSGDDGSPRRAAVHFGDGHATLPAAGLFGVDGSAKTLDLDAWLELVIERFGHQSEMGDLEFESASVRADELTFLNRRFDDVGIDLWLEEEILRARFDGGDIAGTVRYSQEGDHAHSLTAEFDRLLLGDPLTDGMTMETDPVSLPETHLYVREFRYLGLDFGETRIEGYPQANGFRIQSVEAHSSQFVLRARGDWLRDGEGSRSDFDIHMTSESLGGLLDAIGVSAVMEGGQTIVKFDAWWPGPPAAFALSRLNGVMEASVIDGRILNAQPGAGRVLGLLSVAALPRRLALDFRDVFVSGFGFDQATANLTLENGMARTDDLTLSSTAATISVSGSNDLVDQQFDYVITVRPGVGKTLPVIGAIAGGPGGAAAGLALQGLLQKSLGDAAEVRYRMTGPWSDPLVEPIVEPTIYPERNQRDPVASSAPDANRGENINE